MNSEDWSLPIGLTHRPVSSSRDRGPPGGIILCLCLLTVGAAWATPGALSCDEHFQIFEYARYLMGQVRVDQLAWEFSARIRPLLQPLSVSWILEAAQLAGLTSPFDQALVLRLVNGLLCSSVVGWLAWVVTADVEPKRRPWIWTASQVLFFVPILNVHAMSEVWGGVCLAAAMSLALGWTEKADDSSQTQTMSALVVGVVAALSFVFRYQMAFALIGLFLHLVLIGRRPRLSLLMALAAFAIVIGATTLIDGHFYHQPTFAPWRYFDANIVQGRAADFGVDPMYQYGVWLFTKFPLPFGPLIALSSVWFVVTHPRNLLTWVFVPFVLGHSLLGHKEVRFLYPMVPIVVAMFAVCLARVTEVPRLLKRQWIWTACGLFFLLNLGAAIEAVSMLRPRILHLVDAFKNHPSGYRLFWSGDDPTILCSRRMWGLLPPNTEVAPISEFSRPSVVFLEYDRGTERPEGAKFAGCSKEAVGLIEQLQDRGLGGCMKREVLDCYAGLAREAKAAP